MDQQTKSSLKNQNTVSFLLTNSVSVLPFDRGDIALKHIIESEKALHSFTLDDEIVEGGQQENM